MSPMAFAREYAREITRLRVREFNKITAGGGVRLLKCEACGRLTDKGAIIDRDLVEEGMAGQPGKTGYERWILCPECAHDILDNVNSFTDKLIEGIKFKRP